LKGRERIEVVDLLRGLSCLGVLLYHVRVDLWTGWWNIKFHPQSYSSFEKLTAWLSVPTPFMGYAILLFFLISGFCIHYPNTSSNPKPCWLHYFRQRFWRIYPTYLVAVILTASISYFTHIQWDDTTWNVERMFRVALLSQNYPPENGQLLSNPSLWTIPLEIEFYVIYPLAFFLILRIKFTWLILTAFCISGFTVYLMSLGFQWVSYTSLLLWPSWLLGAWVASLHRENKISEINLLVLSFGLVVFLILSLLSRLENWESWLQYGFWTGFYFILFLLVLRFEKEIYGVSNNIIYTLFAWLGKISFSLYLIHFPLFKLFGYIHRDFWGEKPANFLFSVLYLIPVIFLAWTFFKFVENPIHIWSKQGKEKK
jgi:peptidoglycan/LPS O-acetylase OafA/YrhL